MDAGIDFAVLCFVWGMVATVGLTIIYLSVIVGEFCLEVVSNLWRKDE